MSGASVYECNGVAPEVAELRLLTEAHALLQHLDDTGNVPEHVELAVKQNLQTAMAEISMPYAVTTTEHTVEYVEQPSGPPKRVITWLGKNAVALAAGGKDFHFSEPAFARVEVETEEAKRTEETFATGTAQVFISPKMSRRDASFELAKAEHLAEEDSVRVSTAITDNAGKIIGRKMQSLLVRDIPLEAWEAMLQDPNNLFGKSFDLRVQGSALSVMELFSQLDLPEAALPDGPVSIVEAVLPYITDDLAKQKVRHQITRFTSDQKLYADEAARGAEQWYDFELELARSLKSGEATDALQQLIAAQQHDWSDADLAVINARAEGDMQYRVDDALAAVLEKRKRLLLGRVAAVTTKNDQATAKISQAEKQAILQQHHDILRAQAAGMQQAHIMQLRSNLDRQVARTNIKVGGGCAGNVSPNKDGTGNDGLAGLNADSNSQGSAEDSKENWKWKTGKCQVKACPSPNPTEVGPCSVCKRCQAEFDKGHDPTKGVAPRPPKTVQITGEVSLATVLGWSQKHQEKPKQLIAA
ncbi:MAG: hypothetical protein WAQ24_01115 [Candidatus Saccharimonadales bacterium]